MDTCPRWERAEKDSDLPEVVAGLERVHQFIRKRASQYLIRHGDLKNWHLTIFEKVVPLHYYAGNYRCADPEFPCLNVDVSVPPNPGTPFAEVPARMAEFSELMQQYIASTDDYLKTGVSEINRVRAIGQLAAVCMGTFIAVHPFLNGNGRICRMIGNYILGRYNLPSLFWPAIVRPSGHYEVASEACMRGDYKPLFRYLLAALAQQATT